MSVKFYPDPLRFGGVIRGKPILSDYIIIVLSCVMHDNVPYNNLVGHSRPSEMALFCRDRDL